MKFLRKINLEINKDLYNPIQVKQGDNSRYLLFNLLDNGVPFSLENKTVRVYGLKPDGTKVFNNLTIINAARGLAELQLTTQMLVKPGCLKLELVIYEATDILSTTKFDIDIISCIRDDESTESTNEFSALTLGLSKLDEWDKYFKETSGAIEEKYTERLNGIDASLEDNAKKLNNKSVDVKVDFGAKGDGITDDTQAIRNAVRSGAKEVFFPPGTYIINIESGTDNSQRRFFHCLCDRLKGVEGLSIIKLGSGNGQAETFRNYASIFWFSGDTPNRDVEVKGITFDYNYKENTPSHYESRYSGVEENSQNNAITGSYIRNLTVTKCTVIDFSGTNCIDYKCNKDNRGVNYVNVYDNNFIDCGHKFTYKGLDAYHDCSIIAIHKASLLTPKIDKAKLHSYVKNNNFIGAGGNAFNVCESFADYQVFENNYIEKFAQAYLPLTWDGDTYCRVKDNIIKDTKKAIAIWNGYQKQVSIDVRNGFSNLDIDKNTIYINPSYWRKIPLYNENSESDSVIPHFYTGIHCQVPITSIKNINITNNKIEYENSLLKLDEVNKSYKNGDCINFNGNIPTELITLLDYTPTINSFIIKDNEFKNAYNGVIHLESYSTIEDLFIENNKYINCMIDDTLTDKFLVNIELKGESFYTTNTNIVAFIKNLNFKDNYIDSKNISRFVNLSILSANYSTNKVGETYVNYLNNKYTVLPTEAFINFYSNASAIQNVTLVQYLNDNNPPRVGNWKRGSILYNINPQAVGFIGWVCTNSGTPGTWKKFGAIDPSV